jgi:glycosyltransferase involved in cell wall biosynthesis
VIDSGAELHITFLLNQGLAGAGFIGRYFPLAKELVKLGHQVRLLAPHPAFSSVTQPHFWRDGVEVYYVGQMHVRKVGSRKTYMSQRELLKVVATTTWRMFRFAAKLPTDVYQICKAQPINGLAAVLAHCFHLRRPIFVDSDDYETEFSHYSATWQRYVVNGFEKALPRLARGVTAQTRFNVERNISYGVPAHRVLYVPNGVDRERFAEVDESDVRLLRTELGLDACKVVVYVGNLSLATHPVDLLLEAFAQVCQQERGVRLLIVGGGKDYDAVRAQVVKDGLSDGVRFTGRICPERVPAFYRLADVSVEPVRDDVVARARSPIKVFESMAVGTPVVAGDVGDRRKLLGDAGMLVPAGDSDALAQGLLAVLQDNGARQQMAKAALVRRERYYWDVLVHDFVKVYSL